MRYQLVRFTSKDNSDFNWKEPFQDLGEALSEAQRIIARSPCVIVDLKTNERLTFNEAMLIHKEHSPGFELRKARSEIRLDETQHSKRQRTSVDIEALLED